MRITLIIKYLTHKVFFTTQKPFLKKNRNLSFLKNTFFKKHFHWKFKLNLFVQGKFHLLYNKINLLWNVNNNSRNFLSKHVFDCILRHMKAAILQMIHLLCHHALDLFTMHKIEAFGMMIL